MAKGQNAPAAIEQGLLACGRPFQLAFATDRVQVHSLISQMISLGYRLATVCDLSSLVTDEHGSAMR